MHHPQKVNSHIHTPYSFSAFENMEQAFSMAAKENVVALGINDFNTFEGYEEFTAMSRKYRIYPLYNVEFMGLLQKEQQQGIRINDPANAGRIYFSGKGLDYPLKLNGALKQKFDTTFSESNRQTRAMLEKASDYMQSLDADLSLDYDEVMLRFTRGMLRERHIAMAIREEIFAKFHDDDSRKDFFKKLFNENELKSALTDDAGIDNEIRSNALKAGGPAYVKEDPRAFLPLEDIISIIREAGGILCYPVLLDDAKGNYTEYESDFESLYRELSSRNIFSIELIPGRNDFDHLKAFVKFFHEKDFIITFGTEHNTPELIPLTVTTRTLPLDEYLMEVNYEGVCCIAAHQALRSKGGKGITFDDLRIPVKRKDVVQLGDSIISEYCGKKSFIQKPLT
jgi:hypothetical protein